MKKKSIIIGIIVVIILVISIYLVTSSKAKTLGNMKHNYSEQTTTNSAISFLGEAGDKIKFSFRSHIESGDLDITLFDSEGNEVYKLDRAKELETFLNLSNSDTYTLVAKFSDFIGKSNIKVYKVN